MTTLKVGYFSKIEKKSVMPAGPEPAQITNSVS